MQGKDAEVRPTGMLTDLEPHNNLLTDGLRNSGAYPRVNRTLPHQHVATAFPFPHTGIGGRSPLPELSLEVDRDTVVKDKIRQKLDPIIVYFLMALAKQRELFALHCYCE